MSEMAERGTTSSQRDLAKSSRKRTADSALTTSSKKRNVTVTTFNKWKSQFERDYSTLPWLCCDVSKEDKTVVETLWCEACRKHEDRVTNHSQPTLLLPAVFW